MGRVKKMVGAVSIRILGLFLFKVEEGLKETVNNPQITQITQIFAD